MSANIKCKYVITVSKKDIKCNIRLLTRAGNTIFYVKLALDIPNVV